jgi:Uncharacterized protein conserved in bacteria
MKRILMNNPVLKIISILIAVLLWIVVANINDPTISRSYEVPVTIVNSSYIESIGKTYRILEEGQMAKVVLSGPSSIVEGRQNDLEAVADLTQIVDMNTEPYVMVPVTLTCNGTQPESMIVMPQTIKIVLEEMASQEFVIGFDIKNTADNAYRIGEVTAQPEKVKIMGPVSVIQKIDKVVANVEVGGLQEDTVQTSNLLVYDKNQEVLSATSMAYLKFDIGEPTVEVTVDLWRVVPEVSLKVSYSGEPGSGHHVSQISSTPTTIGIAGTEEAIALLKESNYELEIPAKEINISGEVKDVEKKLDLTLFLPEGTKMASDVTTAIVTVSILPVGSKPFVITTKNIEVLGLDESYAVVYDIDEVTINVRGADEVLASINEVTFHPQIDLTGSRRGHHRVPIKVTLPNGAELLEAVEVGVEIDELE